MLAPFRIHEPATVQDASCLLLEHGDEAAIYAGGTELLLLMKDGLVHYPHLVNIKTIAGLDQVAIQAENGAGTLTLGPLLTHRAISRSEMIREQAPLIAQVAERVANARVRAAGTIGGNLCFGEPHSDPATLLLAWNAVMELTSTDGSRQVPAESFFVGLLQTARQPHEVLTSISVPLLPASAGAAYEKFALHERPSVTVAAIVYLREGAIAQARLAVGSVGPTPLRSAGAEEALAGAVPGEGAFSHAGALAARAVSPVDDLYGSAEYKRHLVQVLAARALAAAAERAGRENRT
jgi:carbon-monoxide dehydrogenase medium subunit